MHKFILALQAGPELVTLALRTLEYWVDSLNPEFLEPAMQEVVKELMDALWAHLRPHGTPYGPKVRACSTSLTSWAVDASSAHLKAVQVRCWYLYQDAAGASLPWLMLKRTACSCFGQSQICTQPVFFARFC